MTGELRAQNLTVAFESARAILDISLAFPRGKVTTIVGANGSGKSTLLRALARLVVPHQGQVFLGEKNIATMRRRDLARAIGFLPQTPTAPEGMRVQELISRGRAPHRGPLTP